MMNDFAALVQARAVGAVSSRHLDSEIWAARIGASPRVLAALKAAVPAAVSSSPSWAGDAIGAERVVLDGFSDSLRTSSAFAALLPMMTRAPLRMAAGFVSGGATGYIAGEAKPVPISRLTLANGELTPRTAAAILACSTEMLLAVTSAGQALFERELMGAAP
jgi:hypothetical protein